MMTWKTPSRAKTKYPKAWSCRIWKRRTPRALWTVKRDSMQVYNASELATLPAGIREQPINAIMWIHRD